MWFFHLIVYVVMYNKIQRVWSSDCLTSRRYRFVNRWRVLLGSIYNKPVNANVAEVKTIVYHSSYLPFVDANIDDNSRDIAVLALTQPLTFNGRTHKVMHTYSSNSHIHTHECLIARLQWWWSSAKKWRESKRHRESVIMIICLLQVSCFPDSIQKDQSYFLF